MRCFYWPRLCVPWRITILFHLNPFIFKSGPSFYIRYSIISGFKCILWFCNMLNLGMTFSHIYFIPARSATVELYFCHCDLNVKNFISQACHFHSINPAVQLDIPIPNSLVLVITLSCIVATCLTKPDLPQVLHSKQSVMYLN